jgi:type II secretory pathway pseudopilin PulG
MKKTKNRGFTLIEALIYIGLYTIVIGGALTGAYSLFESSAHNTTKALIEEEGSFLIGKIDWVLSNTKSISNPAAPVYPAVQTVGPSLLIQRFDGSTATIGSTNGSVLLDSIVLNNPSVSVNGTLLFTRTRGSSDGINPDSIEASFTLYATTTSGFASSQKFTTSKFLRK